MIYFFKKLKVKRLIKNQFPGPEYLKACEIIYSVGLNHVMANCESNLISTHLAMLKIAKDDIRKLDELANAAKIDFRDVIMWSVDINYRHRSIFSDCPTR